MYLKVLGGISGSQTHSHFNRKMLVRALDLLSLHTCTNVNQIGAVVLGKLSLAQARSFWECPGSFLPSLSSVPWPRGAVGDQPQGTWTMLWAKLSLTGALEIRKQLGVGFLCGPCSFRRAIPVPIELVPAKLPLSVVRKETLPQGQPVQGAGSHLPNSPLHFIPDVIPLPS